MGEWLKQAMEAWVENRNRQEDTRATERTGPGVLKVQKVRPTTMAA